MMKRLLLALLFTLLAAPAWAATCSVTSSGLQVKDNASTTAQVPYTDDGTGNGTCLPGTLEKNSTATLAAVQATTPAGTNLIGFVSGDPCTQAGPGTTAVKTSITINLSGTSGLYTTPLLPGVAAKKTYICHLFVQDTSASTAVNMTFIEAATGTGCSPAIGSGLFGGNTAATGMYFTSGAGVSLGTGAATIKQTANVNDDICVITNANVQLTGTIEYVQQ
jgi:hypothetical protein